MALSQYPAFVPGTLTFFQQTTAPTGWTKQITNDNYTLRIVSGSGSTSINNSVNFSTAMADVTFTGTASSSGSTSSNDADLPSHNHTVTMVTYGPYASHAVKATIGTPGTGLSDSLDTVPNAFDTNSSPGAHGHSISGSAVPVTGGPGKFAVNYIDFILASKNT
jgi:hypothetical protein